MITEDQKKAFKEVLGSHYTAKVRAILKEQGVKDTFGKTHSARMITQVFNGETAHVLIEDAIVTAVEQQLQENKKIERKKQKLINSLT
tara:strand:- start:7810 stop:8073 length:264 start_codon:yes stop_codon:yes gene_type:complete